jgi:hypothetical protein
MGFIEKLQSPQGVILISILFGLGISCLFRQVCHGRSCIVYRPPPLSMMLNKYFKIGKECYTYHTKVVECNDHPIKQENAFEK